MSRSSLFSENVKAGRHQSDFRQNKLFAKCSIYLIICLMCVKKILISAENREITLVCFLLIRIIRFSLFNLILRLYLINSIISFSLINLIIRLYLIITLFLRTIRKIVRRKHFLKIYRTENIVRLHKYIFFLFTLLGNFLQCN